MSSGQSAAVATSVAVAAPEDTFGQSRVQPSLLSLEDFRIRPHRCFACGELNEIGLHLQLHMEPDRCWIETVIHERFQGWEGIVHGGIISTILDEVMAWSLTAHDCWGVTARMSVQFHRPVEIGRAIRAEGWITESKRRIQRTAARMVDVETGLELATAEATYVAASEAQKAQLKQRYNFGGAIADVPGTAQRTARPTPTPGTAAAAPGILAAGTASPADKTFPEASAK